MLRYLRRLADKDLALDRTMIPLGSCTMKLNATVEMLPITWPEFADVAPVRPRRARPSATATMIRQLERMLVAITGYDAVSLQPNAGSQGELAGLLAIRAYHRSRGDEQRTVCLIPSSAHGTNAASAVMAGMERRGRRLRSATATSTSTTCAHKADAAGDRLAAVMVTYPSTHGVFEDGIRELCAIVHDARRSGVRRRRQPQRPRRPGPARDVRRRRQPPQPAQDVLHPARRRRARASVRSRCAPTSPPFLPGHPLGGLRPAGRPGVGCAVRLGRASCRSRGCTSR